ncbi:sugar ABC transporter ATP-binding protein [Solirubrobacter sp. CPCC 204708]|uniref:Sugar ABC transporter ATP-binding protein n=2 Tax=Solirubrobacter deserti TaxID=2282478 RepID=A0ABT4RKL0_9ACTN|nr:sugar ABC transporter ATP-binding protein [Solirubrobacter deserti]MDA0138820.1 sugar ABC transporter ATP-binding protein [Solirubrobacter deserti]
MEARAVTKVFGATHALKGVDFAVEAGRVTALFGENGAGKSTLMKILAGIEQPTTGELELDGEPVTFASPRAAADRGVVIIHQELSLFPNLSVADNVFMARERVRHGMVDDRAQRQTATALLTRLEEPIDPRTDVSELRLGQQQIVEIARALAQDARVLIMDEPTSALSAAEVEVLFRIIRELTADGVAIVYISHHLEEALEIADHVVVLRDGGLVAEAEAADVDLAWIVEHMVGRSQDELFPEEHVESGGELLRVSELSVPDPRNPGRLSVDGVSLSVRAGEIVGLYGLMGAGRTELLEALAGRLKAVSGEVEIDGELIEGPVAARIARGLTLVPEDRQRDGLVQSMSVGANLSLAGLRRFIRGPLVSAQRERAAVAATMRDVTVKAAGPDAPITSLSGGNQQKVVLGKALLTQPRVLLLDEPTRGIDVGAKADIFGLTTELAGRGVAVLFATSELEEALHVPDRLLVMAKGKVVREVRRGVASREEIMVASEGGER